MSAQKIARQGLTWRHVGVVITMCLTLFTAVGIIFTAAGLCYRTVTEHFGVQTSQVSLYITFCKDARSFCIASVQTLILHFAFCILHYLPDARLT